jgi:hypothetical protein
MSGSEIGYYFAAVVVVCAAYIILDPAVEALFNAATCTVSECVTAVSYMEAFWDRALVFMLILLTIWIIAVSVREATPPSMGGGI